MKKFFLLALMTLSGVVPALASITGSAHDFSASTASGEICVLCHTPHGADTSVSNAPLWNHALTSVVTYTLYDNTASTQDSTPGQPNGVSKLCLSCHDNTVAIDAFGGSGGTAGDFIASYDRNGTEIVGYANIGTDLSDDHPVGITYDTTLVATDGGLKALGDSTGIPGVATVADMLFAGKVECSSCHDVHNSFGNDKLLVKDNSGSNLCLTCHDK